MKLNVLILALLIIGIGTEAYAQKGKKKSEPIQTPTQIAKVSEVKISTFEDSLAYSIGVNMGVNLLKDSLILNPELIKAGLEDMLMARTARLTKEQSEENFKTLNKRMMEKQAAMNKASGDVNKVKGYQFLEENKKKEGVKVTPSGLQYKVIQEGTGVQPLATDQVEVHYEGTLIDGTKFDSSYDRNETITFPLNGVIRGWTEGLQLMKEGAIYMLYIPAELGYGERGAGGVIGPNETLVFKVELKKVIKAEEKK